MFLILAGGSSDFLPQNDDQAVYACTQVYAHVYMNTHTREEKIIHTKKCMPVCLLLVRLTCESDS